MVQPRDGAVLHGPVAYENRAPLETDLQNLTGACAAVITQIVGN